MRPCRGLPPTHQARMIEVDAWLLSSRVAARLIMQVHDELVLEVADDAVESLVGQIRHTWSAQRIIRAIEGRRRVAATGMRRIARALR